jgi:hypothetical protein
MDDEAGKWLDAIDDAFWRVGGALSTCDCLNLNPKREMGVNTFEQWDAQLLQRLANAKTLVPRFLNGDGWDCGLGQFELGDEMRSAVGRAEGRWPGLVQGFAGVGPVEGMGEYQVEVGQEGFQFCFQVFPRGEVAAADDLPHHDTEHDFDLIQPGTMFR